MGVNTYAFTIVMFCFFVGFFANNNMVQYIQHTVSIPFYTVHLFPENVLYFILMIYLHLETP